MIRALVLDVDGVLVGEKIGFNSPNPNAAVIKRLSDIRASGIPVVLCTGKPHYSIASIIDGGGLANPHITNGGSVVIDPIGNAILQKHVFPSDLAVGLLDALEAANIYTELYTVDDYYAVRRMRYELTSLHAHVLQREPISAGSLQEIAKTHEIVKIMPIVPDESGIPVVDRILEPFNKRISAAWGLHPIANPHQFCGVTVHGISKRQTTLDVLTSLGIRPEDALGVGDSTSDWKYMELTGFAAAMANAQDRLKELVSARGNTGFIGGHVDENGVITVFDHFGVPPGSPS